MNLELMTPSLDGAQFNPLSAITIQSVKDLGYSVDVTEADTFRSFAVLLGELQHVANHPLRRKTAALSIPPEGPGFEGESTDRKISVSAGPDRGNSPGGKNLGFESEIPGARSESGRTPTDRRRVERLDPGA